MKRSWVSLVAVAALAVGFSGCSDSSDGKSASNPNAPLKGVDTVLFEGIATPATDAQKNTLQSSRTITVNGEEQAVSFTTLMATGHADNGEVFGLVKDINDNPIKFEDGSNYICNGTNDGVGSGLDYSSILQKNGKIYMVNQFECQVGAMYKFELDQDKETGALSPKADTLEFISQKDEFGGFVHCAGQTTPWNSHLGSEEYESDARSIEGVNGATGSKYYDETVKFWGGDFSKMSPYFYGWTPEVQIMSDGSANYMKHYAMGRFSHELAYVMPDKKTVYQTDDGANVALFVFVADKAEDLSAGTLYAGKFEQTSAGNAGAFNISWIDLGHATNDEIRDYVANMTVFSDIFETADANANFTCPTGFTSINASAGHECLKVKDGMEKVASRLETRRYAAMKGATTEFRKMEGFTYDEANKKAYLAMSNVARGMADGYSASKNTTKYDDGGNNDLRVPENICGAVYSLSIGADMMATDMMGTVEGMELAEADAYGNTCHADMISQPDNVAMLPGTSILMIGEDTSKHTNNVIWAYDTMTGALTRTLTTPVGAETTSPFWYADINGWGYMTAVTQHPKVDGAKESSVGVIGNIKFK
ncbi:MAG: DUF839 domain-containing protein [Campylobacterota bacterium]|nr:DUF839 domain-containing protein [Campylobacterota bacterium]